MATLNNKQITIDSSRPDLWLVAKEHIPVIWDELLDLLNRTPDEGALKNWESYDLFDILVSDTNYFLSVGYHEGKIEAAMVLSFIKMPNNMVIQIESGNGPLFKYLPYLEKLERWAFKAGASEVEIRGPKGLIRAMAKSGYTVKEYVLTKPIRKMWSN